MKVDFFVTIGYNRDTGGRGGGGGGDNNTASQTYITNNDGNDKLNSIKVWYRFQRLSKCAVPEP